MLDSSGNLIGMNTAIYSPSGASAGVGFAIPIDAVKMSKCSGNDEFSAYVLTKTWVQCTNDALSILEYVIATIYLSSI